TKVRALYEEKGYQAAISPDLGMKDGLLTFPIIVGKIQSEKVNGLHKTKKKVVLREMKQKPGQYYNVAQLRKDLTAILNTDLFEVGFTEPWLDNHHTSLSINLFDKTVYRFAQQIGSIGGPVGNEENIYFETHTGGQITLSRPIGSTVRGYIGARYDNIRVPTLALSTTDLGVLQNGPVAT